jgi:hypothetical protein
MLGVLAFLGACGLVVGYDIFLRDKVVKEGRKFFGLDKEKTDKDEKVI